MVSQAVQVLLVVAKTVTVVFGSGLTALAWRAARRTGSPALRALAVGIGILTAGALLGGVLHQALGVALAVSVTLQSVCTALGLGVMLYSLYTEETNSGDRRGATPSPRD